MEVYKRINQILKKQNITKREFAKRLILLEPKLKSTGEVPSEKAIYSYLSGASNIKIELISDIAEALRVSEQTLFTNDKKSRRKFVLNFIKTANDEEIKILKEKLQINLSLNSYVEQPKSYYGKNDSEYTLNEQLISLLQYSPKPLTLVFINKLKEIKNFTNLI